MLEKIFVYIWEFKVKEAHQAEFKKINGPEGDWSQLFRKARGYIATDLHQDRSNPNRFITVDFWKTKKDRDKFRSQFSKEFKIIDDRCENYTEREKLLGEFDSYTLRYFD